jgi:hypothetical protein
MENKDLLKLQKSIPHFFSYFKEENVLAISDNKDKLPFAFVINDDEYKFHLLLSIAIDYPNAEKAVELALYTNKIKPAAITESFYISQNGTTYTGDEAYKYWSIDLNYSLNEIDPESNTQH